MNVPLFFVLFLIISLSFRPTDKKSLSARSAVTTSKEPRPEGGALNPKFLNPKTRSRNKFGMTKRPEPNCHVMLNLFQHLVCFFSAFSRRTFHPRPQDGVFRCNLNNFMLSLIYNVRWGYGRICFTLLRLQRQYTERFHWRWEGMHQYRGQPRLALTHTDQRQR